MRRWWMVAVWVLATVGAVAVARLAVGIVADQVDVSTAAPLSDQAVSEALEESRQREAAGPDGASTDTTDTTDSTSPSPSPGSSPSSQPPSAQPPAGPTPTTDTAPPPAPEPVTRTYDLVGGSVAVRFEGDGTVGLVFATPNSGFELDVSKNGPDEVRVEFESDGHESRLRALWRDGQPHAEIDERPG